ncbi:MAG TPA: hypothetical protein VME20_05700 [Acidimicrobiales bacterium]|nr:hypothetical protein [Acidimicrobiales bacterium]
MRERDKVLAVAALVVVLGAGAALDVTRKPPPIAALALSTASGPPGTLVTVSGDAGAGCSRAKDLTALDFEPSGKAGRTSGMTVPTGANGLWSATFAVPSYLGGAPTVQHGGVVVPGRYQFVAELCNGTGRQIAAFRVSAAPPEAAPKSYVGIATTPDGRGYWLVANTGEVDAFGDARQLGSLTAMHITPTAPIVGVARTADGGGYWLAGADGHLYSFGDAASFGPLPGNGSGRGPITGVAATPDGHGVWLVGADGQIYGFGDARGAGTPPETSSPYDAIAARPAGGYLVSTATGAGVYAFSGGWLLGGSSDLALRSSLVGAAVTPSGNGAWQAGADGGVFTSGDATFYGSLPGDNITPDTPVTGIAATPDGRGYWLVGADGTVFSFGDAGFFGMAYDGRA